MLRTELIAVIGFLQLGMLSRWSYIILLLRVEHILDLLLNIRQREGTIFTLDGNALSLARMTPIGIA